MKVLAWLNKKFDEYLAKKVKEDIERRDRNVALRIVSRTPYGR